MNDKLPYLIFEANSELPIGIVWAIHEYDAQALAEDLAEDSCVHVQPLPEYDELFTD